METQDYYQILNVSKDADMTQIKKAYRDLAVKYHPDRNMDDPAALDTMKQINEAYAVLSDSKKRQDYDSLRNQYGSADAYTQFRHSYSDQDIFKGTDIQKVFDELAQSFGFRNFGDIFQQFDGAGSNKFEFKGSNFSMRGGFFFGTMNFGKSPSKSSLPGKMGWVARKLLQNLSGSKIPLHGKDLHDTIQVNKDLAEKGGPYAYYHTWQSKKLVITIPSNTRNGQQIRLKGMGAEGQGGGRPGDLYLKIETNPSIVSKIRKFLPF